MKLTTISTCLISLIGFTMISGCGGGTSSTPTVTARPKTADPVKKENNVLPGNGGKTGNGDKPKTASGKGGTFAGVVTFDGAAPAIGAPSAFNPGNPKTDPQCVKVKGNVKDLSLIVNPANKGVQNVFVYVLKTKAKLPKTAAPTTPVVFDQKACTFINPALIVRVGQPVEVRNSDNTGHNTHTNPLNPASQAYNKSLSPGQSDKYSYGGAENMPVKVVCDIHNWMLAYQLPVDHGFAVLTDKDGKFKIEGLPEGDYTFRIWHGRAGYLEKEFSIYIENGKVSEEKFNYPSSKFMSFNGPQPKTLVLSLNK